MSHSRSSGFTIIEVVFSLGVLTLLILGLVTMNLGTIRVTEIAQERRLALNKAEAVLARLLADTSLRTRWSNGATGPKPAADTTTVLATGGSGYVYDFLQDPVGSPLGETLPPELGALAKGSFRIESLEVDPMRLWTLQSPPPFTWSQGDCYRVTVWINWQPATQRRSGETAAQYQALVAAGNAVKVQVESIYYRPPQ